MKNRLLALIFALAALSGCAYGVKKELPLNSGSKAGHRAFAVHSFQLLGCDVSQPEQCAGLPPGLAKSADDIAKFQISKESKGNLRFYQQSPGTVWPFVSALTLGLLPTYETTVHCIEYSQDGKVINICSDYRTYYWFPFYALFIHKSGAYAGLQANFRFLVNALINDECFRALAPISKEARD